MQDFIYLQAALANLSMALKILDEIGCTVSAAHVELQYKVSRPSH